MRAKIETVIQRESDIAIKGRAENGPKQCEIRIKDARGRKVDAHLIWEEEQFVLEVMRRDIKTKSITVQVLSQEEIFEHVIDMAQLGARRTIRSKIWKIVNPLNFTKNVRYVLSHNLKELRHAVTNLSTENDRGYSEWFERNRITAERLAEQRTEQFAYEPLISIAVPLYNTPIPFLEALLKSVTEQSYANWQLCLADGSTTNEAENYIEQSYGNETRIVYRRLEENMGIAGNTNAALTMAGGEFVMLTDHDDLLEPDALYEIVKELNRDAAVDIVYTDEDLTDVTGTIFSSPRMKPDFDIDFLRSINYICHIFMVRKEILDRVGGFRKEFDGAQDWDLILRCCEQTKKIAHIPRVLYHWRAHEDSTAGNPDSKQYAIDAGRRAVEAHYARMGIEAEVLDTDIFIMFRTLLSLKGEPKVSVIIPNKDESMTLKKCVDSILEKTTYRNYEIIIVENNSTEKKTFAYYKKLKEEHDNVKVVFYEGDFNYSKINNYGVKYAAGEYYILLNNDTEVITRNWMEQMLGYCQRADVGMVGAKLLYPDQTVQHCGVTIGIGGFAGHILTQAARDNNGYFGWLQTIRAVSAVTAACLMIKKSAYEAVGGLDEDFKVALNDVDLCMKVRDKGLLIIINPGVELYHYESKSRGLEETPEKHERFKGEIKRFRRKWKKELDAGDPYYNPNLSLMYGDCRVRGEGEHFDIVDEIERDFREMAEQS